MTGYGNLLLCGLWGKGKPLSSTLYMCRGLLRILLSTSVLYNIAKYLSSMLLSGLSSLRPGQRKRRSRSQCYASVSAAESLPPTVRHYLIHLFLVKVLFHDWSISLHPINKLHSSSSHKNHNRLALELHWNEIRIAQKYH